MATRYALSIEGRKSIFGETDAPDALFAAVRGHRRQTNADTPPEKKGIFKRVYRRARPYTEREFASLVAVYRHVHWGKPTTSVHVRKLASRVEHPMSNASTAMSEAVMHGGIARDKKSNAKPIMYRPTDYALKEWSKFVR